jgi:type I restriction enzyme S subunit
MISEVQEIAGGLNIDRSNWEFVKFGDIAIQQKENVDREATDLTQYIAGEHMDTEDLHIRKWGELTEDYLGPAFHRKFEKGDVLYGSRRTYLRKVAVAHFDGITSNTTFVIKANEELIDKRLLPFVMLSEGFAQHSIKNSKGSVNPYVNYKDIASYEFLLPPKGQQEQITELFWRSDETLEKLYKLKSAAISSKRSFFKKKIKGSTFIKLSKIAKVSYGLGQPPERDNSGIPMIRATNIFRGAISLDNMIYIKEDSIPKRKDPFLKEGDLLVVRSGAYTGDVAMITKDWDGAIAGYDLVVRPFRDMVDPLWLTEYLLEDENQAYFKGESVRSAQPHLNSTQVSSAKVPNIELEKQKEISRGLTSYYTAITAINQHISQQKDIIKSLVNQVF